MAERDQEELFVTRVRSLSVEVASGAGTRKRPSVVLEPGRMSGGLRPALTLSWSTGLFAGVPRCPPSGVPKVLGPGRQALRTGGGSGGVGHRQGQQEKAADWPRKGQRQR